MSQTCLICFEDYCVCTHGEKKSVQASRYRKKPIIIEAIKVNMNNPVDTINFFDGLQVTAWESGCLRIETLEGNMIAYHGDYIIKGIMGEFYPCRPDIFEKTYELAT